MQLLPSSIPIRIVLRTLLSKRPAPPAHLSAGGLRQRGQDWPSHWSMAFPQRHPTAASAARKRMASASQRATLLRSSADREADDLQNFLKSPHRTGRRLRSSRLRLERRIDGTPSKKHLRPRTGDRTHAIASMVRARGRGRRGFGEIEMRVVRGHRSGGRRDGAVTYLGIW